MTTDHSDKLLHAATTTPARVMSDADLQKRSGMRTIAMGETALLQQLDPALRRVMIGVGWDIPGADLSGIDIDASIFLLNKNDLTEEDSDFIFYNNLNGRNGAAEHLGDNRSGAGDGDDEQIVVHLQDMPFSVMKIAIVISIHDADMRDQSVTLLRNAYVRLVNRETDTELIRYPILTDFTDPLASGLIAGLLVREGPTWLFTPMEEQVHGGLGAIATRDGMMMRG